MSSPLGSTHEGEGWYQLLLLDYLTWLGQRSMGSANSPKDETRLPVVSLDNRPDRELKVWGSRWVGLLMTGYFNEVIPPDGFKLRGVSYHSKDGEALLRLTAVKNGAGLVAFVKERPRYVWYDLFVRVNTRTLVWKPDKYHEPSTTDA